MEESSSSHIFWLNVNPDYEYWKTYPFVDWQLGANNDKICYDIRNFNRKFSNGDLAIFYETQKGIRNVGRVYKIDDDFAYFEIIAQRKDYIDLERIKQYKGLEDYPPKRYVREMKDDEKISGTKLIEECLKDNQPKENTIEKTKTMQNSHSNKHIPLNQILYGPPGTGKTYHTINKALEILGIDTEGKTREELKQIFDNYKQKGQIEFITFHQSFSYEEFVEGIKPNLSNQDEKDEDLDNKKSQDTNNSKEMQYKIQDGIFKQICRKALEYYKENKEKAFDITCKKILNDIIKDCKEQGGILHQDKRFFFNEAGSYWYVENSKLKIYFNNIIQIISELGNCDFNELWIEMMSHDDGSFASETPKLQEVLAHSRILHIPFEYSELEDIYITFLDYFYEIRLKECVNNNPLQFNKLNLILIIDEINRGNIAKILGELITLIEPNKRIGNSESLQVKLPYSNELFGIPNNLYIIGTMNTADRSIAMLDTALRRRFEFIEMMPETKDLSTNCDGVDLQRLLQTMNNRIEFLLDREHTLGHAFFINAKNLQDLKEIFKHKIIPLLQEYFYEDYAKINAVFNNNGMIESKTMEDLNIYLSDDFVDSDKKVYRIAKDCQEWQFRKIYD